MREPFLGQPVFCKNNSQWAGYILGWSNDSVTVWNYVEGKADICSLVEFKNNFTTKPPKGEPIYLSGAGLNGQPLQIGTVPEPKIIKRGRLDILQDLTEQGANWRLETDSSANAIKWYSVIIDGCHEKTFNNIRDAIDWIIEQVCEGGK